MDAAKREYWERVIEVMPLGILLIGEDARILCANSHIHNLFGYEPQSIQGLALHILLPHANEKCLNQLTHTTPDATREDADYTLGLCRDGSELPLEIKLAPIESQGTLVILQDISERQSLQHSLTTQRKKLSDSEDRIRVMYDMLPIGLLLVNNQGKIKQANKHAGQLFATSQDTLINTSVDALVPDNVREDHHALRAQYQKKPKPRRMAKDIAFLSGRRTDGSLVPLEIGLAPIKLDGEAHTIVSLVDTTERKRLIDELKDKNHKMDIAINRLTESNEQLERFAYICSHDLQEPVRMVQSFSGLLERHLGNDLDDKSQKYLSFISEGASRAKDMISDVLAFCRLEQPLHIKEEVELASLIEQVRDTLRLHFDDKNAQVVCQGSLPALFGVRTLLFQLFLNLINNGIKFNQSAAPTVWIRAQQQGQHWHISVTDNGIGIRPEYQSKIFNVFERLHSRASFPGTGIGLATCAKIAKLHDAELTVSSEEGHGATFALLWPIHSKNQIQVEHHDEQTIG